MTKRQSGEAEITAETNERLRNRKNAGKSISMLDRKNSQ